MLIKVYRRQFDIKELNIFICSLVNNTTLPEMESYDTCSFKEIADTVIC